MSDIIKAEETDLQEILQLQKLAFLSEAEMIGSTDIPALKQTYDDIMSDYRRGLFLKACNATGKIIGSIRAFETDDCIDVGKLMVHPDFRRQGLASKLLYEIEKYYPDKRLELYTCTKSLCNISLYESVGYKRFKVTHGTGELDFVYLEKHT